MNQRLHRPAVARTVRVHPGFTMMEALLSMSLISLLMVAILASTTLYVQYRSRSIHGNRAAVVLRGTLDDIQNDLRSCLPALATWHTSSPIAGELNVTTVSDNSIGERVLQDDRSEEASPVHFVGRRDALLLLRAGLNPRFPSEHDVKQEQSPRGSQVLWLSPSRSEINLPVSRYGGRVVTKRFRTNESTPGLCRATLSHRDDSGPIWDVNSEVVAIQFRFFDGNDWLAMWDSHLRNESLPVAVELTVAFREDPSNACRIVTYLPCGQPTE
ncbi:hypothetical protein [Neorhodopirellula pilleata]|uniref:Pseudopilin GspJ n=1 Tax=Neorhodopirellula pilleata TaxID=2714738 RepID=A0A5C6A4B7_9BACT|nr:hypothetical protein [Neorhodopirellula pilleata]TWT94210.1 hypothetical protein Pla100_38200 [Neorhodopirellula pilleata]